MRKTLIILIALLLLLGVSGCKNMSEPNEGASPEQGVGLLIGEDAQRQVDIANANSLATAINAYNALHPDSGPLPDSITIKDLREVLGKALWPRGLSDEGARRAWKLIIYKDGAAVAAPEAQ